MRLFTIQDNSVFPFTNSMFCFSLHYFQNTCAIFFFFSIYMLFYSLCFVYVMPNHIYLVNYYLSLNLRILYPWHSLLWLALSRADDAHYSIIESLCILIDDYHSIVVTAPCILFYQIVCQGNGFINSLTIGSIE